MKRYIILNKFSSKLNILGLRNFSNGVVQGVNTSKDLAALNRVFIAFIKGIPLFDR